MEKSFYLEIAFLFGIRGSQHSNDVKSLRSAPETIGASVLHHRYRRFFRYRRLSNGSFAPILLKKSFWGGERNVLEPLMRFVRDDARDPVASQKNDHGLSYRRYGASQR